MIMQRVPWRAVGLYLLVAYAALWLVCIPFYVSSRGLALPGASLIIVVGMFGPFLASALACRTVRRPWRITVGLTIRPVRRTLLAAAAAFGGVVVATGVGLALGPLVGMRLSLAGLQVPGVPISPGLLLVIALVQVVIASFTINAAAALGEEVGWRGFLLPALLPLGRVPAVIIVGIVWAGWHLPLVLLGYEFTGTPRPVAMIVFTVFCIAFGAGLAWLRLRFGSVLPCAVAHGTVNSVATLTLLLPTADRPLLLAPAGLLGTAAFMVLAAVLFRRLPVGRDPGGVASPGVPDRVDGSTSVGR